MAATRDLIVIGASAGGISALRTLLPTLPAGLRSAILIVVHVAPESPALLKDILRRCSALPVDYASDGQRIERGRVLLAPPDRHLLVEHDVARLSHGPRENRHRPSIDVLFRSAAVACGGRVIGVLLSGMLDDGSAGLWAIKRRGGVAVVQDPAEAEYPDMPRNAMSTVRVDRVLPLDEMGGALVALTGEPIAAPAEDVPSSMLQEVRMASDDQVSMSQLDALGKRVPFTCPECGGALWVLEDTGSQRFRCHVGHAYSLRTLASEQSARVEAALWAALRSLEENEKLANTMSAHARRLGNERTASRWADNARSTASHAETLRSVLATAGFAPPEEVPDSTTVEDRK